MKRFQLILITFLGFLGTTTAWSSDNHDHHEAEEQHQYVKGSHGGKVLTKDAIEVEFAIAHDETTPHFRIWVSQQAKPVENATLQLTLKRLGEAPLQVAFHKKDYYWQGDIAADEPHSYDLELSLTLNNKSYHWDWSSYENRVEIHDDMAAKNGLTFVEAQPGIIKQKLRVFGRLQASPDNTADIKARFPGIVQSVSVNIGDQVKQGQILATIESNESLQNYDLKSPIDGMLQHRMVNVGEVTGKQSLFKLLNNTALWAELKVFHNQRKQVKQNQPVELLDDEQVILSNIHHIIPGPANEPYLLARVKFDNSDLQHTPGDLVSADIIVAKEEVSLRVENKALHQLNGKTVIFIKEGEHYEPRQVVVARSDSHYTEIIAGLNSGATYVLDNSYLIKADIEKSGAGHAH